MHPARNGSVVFLSLDSGALNAEIVWVQHNTAIHGGRTRVTFESSGFRGSGVWPQVKLRPISGMLFR